MGCSAVVFLGAALLVSRLQLAEFALWARSAGGAGVATLALALVASALVVVPSWPLRVAAGFVYGSTWGFALALVSTFAGCLLAFVAGRSLLRERVARRLARDARFAAIDAGVGKGGFWMVLLLRLSPVVPNELVNYGLGASRVGVRPFASGTLLGLVPLTASFAWIGSLLHDATDLASGRPEAIGAPAEVLWWVGLATTVALVAAGVRLARRALDPVGARTATAGRVTPSAGRPAMLAIDG